jgi:hypothetical protein
VVEAAAATAVVAAVMVAAAAMAAVDMDTATAAATVEDKVTKLHRFERAFLLSLPNAFFRPGQDGRALFFHLGTCLANGRRQPAGKAAPAG